ncbi:hypothetical protein FB45DRAFT_201157 [Roridomyces roridus]|uniref:Uncharacterized protein n=1 Tax=Roridomyces roridus TaxID=1738132 RepID=A0AAD7CFW1_9AGAR|nr:hypothetical protein FB45DRAFT_201157 [Roridomyces roridus]
MYSHYQSAPGFGTNQWQAPAPPPPAFSAQPQPNWGGADFYNAHALQPDPSIYENAWDRVRNNDEDADGVGVHEAKHWHRRAYGGLGDLSQMDNGSIGAAAAYEAYRTWIHNSSMSAPLSGDVERQREGLTGLAVAEASRLLQYAGRGDHYARREVSEAAASTASILFYHSRAKQDHREYGRGRSRSRGRDDGEYGRSDRRGSFSDSYDDDPYALDSRVSGGFRPRSHSRHRAHSSSRHSPMMYQGSAVGGSSVGPPTMQMPYPATEPMDMEEEEEEEHTVEEEEEHTAHRRTVDLAPSLRRCRSRDRAQCTVPLRCQFKRNTASALE